MKLNTFLRNKLNLVRYSLEESKKQSKELLAEMDIMQQLNNQLKIGISDKEAYYKELLSSKDEIIELLKIKSANT